MQSKRNVMQKKGKKMQEKMRMQERNKNKMQGGAGSNMGGARIKKKDIGPKKREEALLGLWEREPNRFGSSEPDRFRIVYIKGFPVFFCHFFFPFSFFSHF